MFEYRAVAQYNPEIAEVQCKDIGLLKKLYPEDLKEFCREKARDVAKSYPKARVTVSYDFNLNLVVIGLS